MMCKAVHAGCESCTASSKQRCCSSKSTSLLCQPHLQAKAKAAAPKPAAAKAAAAKPAAAKKATAPLGPSTSHNVQQHKGTQGGKAVEEIYQKKSQLEHILLRPDTYIGSTEKQQQTLWVHDGERLVYKPITYAPGLFKIFDEILVNAADNKVRDPTMDTIRVDISPVRTACSKSLQRAACCCFVCSCVQRNWCRSMFAVRVRTRRSMLACENAAWLYKQQHAAVWVMKQTAACAAVS
jgi:hypothetical protein